MGSKFYSSRYEKLIPYVPGEQPQDKKYIKLNTNESPFTPAPGVLEAVCSEVDKLQLYNDPECTVLRNEMSKVFDISPEKIIMTNGSDEVLNFSFMAFSDAKCPLVFPNITYGFYSVFCELNHIPYNTIPLRDDFSINIEDYVGINKNIVLANPNAPTCLYLELSDIERIVASNPDNIVIIDEAYIDFGGQSARYLINKYKNLIVTGTFSKSRNMAGARLGFGFADAELINDINTIKYSTNPYNVNRMTQAAGIATLKNNDYYMEKCNTIIQNREYVFNELKKLDFEVLPSKTNFLFAKCSMLSGTEIYQALRERGILVRHFNGERISDYNRITIGTMADMELLIKAVKDILGE